MYARSDSHELTLTRIYEFPVRQVWDAWTDVNQAAKWWGPRGFTITTHSKDLRTGGSWHYTMHGPDGTDYENITKYFEVVPLKRLVYDHGAGPNRPPLFRVTVNFTETAGRTTMQMTMAFATPEAAAESAKFIKFAGGNATWDRLGEYLEKSHHDQDVFIINRVFLTDPQTMFRMWTDPEQISRWLPPTGMTMKYIHAEVREGGESEYEMATDNFKLRGKCRYLELKKPDRVVYLQWFVDEAGQVGRHPGLPQWPAMMKTTVLIQEETPTLTRVRVEWRPHGDVNAAEIAAFIEHRGSMTQGWTGSFDKLEAIFAEETPRG